MVQILVVMLTAIQLNTQDFTSFEKALSNGNANAISEKFSQQIKFCIGDDAKILNSKSALKELESFFEENKPESYLKKHAGGDSSTNYTIGTLKTNKGNFRVYVYYIAESNDFTVEEIRFTPI